MGCSSEIVVSLLHHPPVRMSCPVRLWPRQSAADSYRSHGYLPIPYEQDLTTNPPILCPGRSAHCIQPYLVAAAIDYEPLPPPLIHGSVTRHIHSSILSKRRQALGLEPTPMPQSLPDALDPASADQRELEGGTVLVGRLSLKEYLEGLRRGWTGGVDEWSLEGHVKRKVEGDGVFDAKAEDAFVADGETNPTTAPQDASVETNESTRSPTQGAQTPFKASGLSFLSRPTPPSMPTPANPSTSAPAPPPIPAHLHTPPATLPPQAPLLLLPFTNHLGVMQFPNMIYDFFTERFKVRDGADAALALIFGQTRPFRGPTTTSSPSSTATDPSNTQESSDGTEKQQLESDNTPKSVGGDLDFDLASESYIRKSYNRDFLNTLQTARRDYYAALAPRIESARAYEEGKRELTEAEQSGKTKVETIEELKEERIKKEMRWMGGEDGFEVVRKGSRVSWDPKWEGWLSVFVKPEEDGSKLGATEHASS